MDLKFWATSTAGSSSVTETRTVTAGDRIVFLDYLRAFACLLVVFGHAYMMGTNDWVSVSAWLPFVNEPIFGADSPQTNIFNQVTTWLVLDLGISVGSLGVSIFFLVSGFIILRALDRETVRSFLIRRAFRLFPLSLLVSAGVAVVTAILCFHYNVPNPHSYTSVVATGFAVPGFFGTYSTLPVIWSLTVEVVFYLYLALASALLGHIGFRQLTVLSFLSAGFAALTQSDAVMLQIPPSWIGAVTTLGFCAFHISFLLIGSGLYRVTQSQSKLSAVVWVGVLCALFALSFLSCLVLGKIAATGTSSQSLLVAFLIFVFAMVHGLRSSRLEPLKFLGTVSYPLYLVHVPAAWVILVLLAHWKVELNIAACIAMTVCVGLAWALHVTVEVPSQWVGRMASKRFA